MARISIIVPIYNSEKTLKRCIESILVQTFRDFELILVNDGSTDQSSNICEDYQLLDDRVKIVHQNNGGQSRARNKGMDMAVGDYFSFVDSDDFIKDDMYEMLYQLASSYDLDIMGCAYQEYEEGTKLEVKKITPKPLNTLKVYKSKEVMETFLKESYFSRSPWCKLYKASLCENVRFEAGRIHEDNVFNYRLFAQAKKAGFTDYIGYYYVKNSNSTTKSSFTSQQFHLIEEERKILKDVMKSYPHLVDWEIRNLALRYNMLLSKILFEASYWELFNKGSHTRKFLDESNAYFKEDKKYFIDNALMSSKLKKFFLMIEKYPTFVGILYKISFPIIKARRFYHQKKAMKRMS